MVLAMCHGPLRLFAWRKACRRGTPIAKRFQTRVRTNRQRFQKHIRRRRRIHWSRISSSLICFASAKYPLRRTTCLCENHEVIGVANERQATPFQRLVQIIQQDVGQKWRERPALRRALRAGLQNPFDHHARPQASFPPWVAPEQLLSPRALPIGAVTWSVDLLQAPNLAHGTYTPCNHAHHGRTLSDAADSR